MTDDLTDDEVLALLTEEERRMWMAALLLPDPGPQVAHDLLRRLALARRELRERERQTCRWAAEQVLAWNIPRDFDGDDKRMFAARIERGPAQPEKGERG